MSWYYYILSYQHRNLYIISIMGNNKSLYKSYFTELNLYKPSTHSNNNQLNSESNNIAGSTSQKQDSPASHRRTPESSPQMKQTVPTQLLTFKVAAISGNPMEVQSVPFQRYGTSVHHMARQQNKVFKVYLDENHSFTVDVPDKLPLMDEEGGKSTDIKDVSKQSDTTCGWLMEQVEMKYAKMIKQSKQNKQKMTQKIIVTLKTVDQNENIDFWLTQYSRTLKALPNLLELEAHYSKIILNKPKKVCINDFESLKVIGKGGFSKVYMVRKKDTGFLFAMKVMKKNYVTNDSKLKQIMNERTIMEALVDHPFIIKLHYAFQSKENLHFIIDLCTGGEMFYHLQQRHHYPEYMAKFYFAEILLGLDFLHSKGIVYRDLKPENVLIDIDGHIKLADFGLSKIFKQDERSFSFCGSPEYMCPEILKREGHNHMVDYYTLGAILFEIMTGLPPYYTNNKSEMTKRILESELNYPSHLNCEVIDLMKGLLERNPSKRLGSGKGIEEIKEQEWCKDIDWIAILSKKITPPWKPRLDQSNFDPEYTSLPLNFDEQNFKRSLQGDREFSFYYESPCQSLTVTEHSIYCSASNSDLVSQQLHSQPSQAYMEMELLLKCGSSKKLIDHFKQHSEQNPKPNNITIDQQKLHELLIAQLQYQGDRSSILFTQSKIEEVIIQEHQMTELNMETALRINQNLIRDESKINLEYNEESGLTNFRGFSFYGESEQENQVKKQLIKYTKLRNKLNKKLKLIQDEHGVIRRQDIINLCLSSPDSSLNSSFITNTVLPTPPVLEEGASSNYSNRPSTQMQSSQSSRSSPQPLFKQSQKMSNETSVVVNRGMINKKMKQQMICAKLEETKSPSTISNIQTQPLYKSFQPVEMHNNAHNLKNNPFGAMSQQHHKDYLDDSMQNVSSNEESVAEERKTFNDSEHIRMSLGNDTLAKDKKKVDFQVDIKDLNRSLIVMKQGQDIENPSEESSQEVSTLNPLHCVKFHLFQSNTINKVDKSIRQQLKQNKIVVTQRNRNTKTSLATQQPVYSRKSTTNQQSTLSHNTSNNTTSNSRIQQMIHNAQHQSHANSSCSQIMANSRDHCEQYQTTLTNQTSNNEHLSEHKSASEKTNTGIEYVSTKHTYGDHHSIKSSIMKKTFENSDQQSYSFQECQNNMGGQGTILDTQLTVGVAITIGNSIIKINKKEQSNQQQKTIDTITDNPNKVKAKQVKSVRKVQIPAFKKNLEIDIGSPGTFKDKPAHFKTSSLQFVNDDDITNSIEIINDNGLRKVQKYGFAQSLMPSPKGDLGNSSKKLPLHYKQMSLDYNTLNNELFNVKHECIKLNLKNINMKTQNPNIKIDNRLMNTITNKNVNPIKVGSSIFQSTPTNQGSIKRLGLFGPSPKNQLHKHIAIADDTFDNNQQESDDDQDTNTLRSKANTNNSQNSKKITSNTSKKDKPSKLPTNKLTTLKAQASLKKGTQATNSTVGFLKTDQVLVNPLPSTKASNSKNFVMKPPVNKTAEGTIGNINSQSQYPASKKQVFQSSLAKQGCGNMSNSSNNNNMGNNTPSGSKVLNQNALGIGIKGGNSQQAYSLPTSAKNAQSQKFIIKISSNV